MRTPATRAHTHTHSRVVHSLLQRARVCWSVMEDLRRARALLSRALELDPQDADAHVFLAMLEMDDTGDAVRATSLLQRALEIDASHALAHQAYRDIVLSSVHGG